MTNSWQSLLEQKLNSSIASQTRLSGGDFADSQCVVLSNQRRVFVKTHVNPPPNFFSTEANGLTWLRDTGCVSVPEVLVASDDPPCLALEWIDEGIPHSSGEAEFGRQLAQLHKQPFECFGRPDQRTTGSLALPNTPSDDWVNFFRNDRLLPLVQRAIERQALPLSVCERITKLADQLEHFAPPDGRPSLVHGDLWAGNRIVDKRGVSWLIDPAAHGNHREFDLAMMQLFGGFDTNCIRAYNDEYPLDDNWQERVGLFQLPPLMVHAIKFGGGYGGRVVRVLDQFKTAP